MVRPIDDQMSLMQVQTALEIINSAQREAALVADRREQDQAKANEASRSSVTKAEEATGKTIRDDDPRPQRQRQDQQEEQDSEDGCGGSIDIEA